MKVYEVVKGCTSLEGLRQAQRPEPQPGWHEVLIRVRATSINYRDHMVVMGRYLGGAVERDTIPLSDGAGEVVSIGQGVTRFKAGDRVAGTFSQVWFDGPRRKFLPRAGSSARWHLGRIRRAARGWGGGDSAELVFRRGGNFTLRRSDGMERADGCRRPDQTR